MDAQYDATPMLNLTISAIREEAPGVKTFSLLPPTGMTIAYKAGQFLTFLFQHGNREDRRSYSVSSAPAVDEVLAITVKRIANGAHSRWLTDRAVVGETLLSTGFGGRFTLPEQGKFQQLFFFAAGIGITPIYSMIRELLRTDPNARAVLVYSSRSAEETVFFTELQELAALHPDRFRIEWRFSNAKNLLAARVSKPVLPAILKQHLEAAPANVGCFICGPEDYRWMMQLLLEDAGIPSENIRKEIFLAGRMPLPALPPDTSAHHVRITLSGKEHNLVVQYPDTILSAAQKAGIPLPYSCAAGRCASCISRCTRGKVWMSYNEVLTAKDLESGLVLCCTGYPVNGDVDLFIE